MARPRPRPERLPGLRPSGSGKRIHVHHRRPGVTQERFLITLCPGHHAMIHCLEMVDRLLRALVLELWREQHPEASEQLALDFNRWDSGHVYLRDCWEIPG